MKRRGDPAKAHQRRRVRRFLRRARAGSEVAVYPEKLASFNVSENQILQLLASENKNYPVGQIEQGDSKLLIRSIGEFALLTR